MPLDTKSLFHGQQVRKKLPSHAKKCTVDAGFTTWHLIALGLFPADILNDYLTASRDQPDALLKQDMQEFMEILTDEYKSLREEKTDYPMTWEQLVALSAYRNVAELCEMTQKPFLSWYTLSPNLVLPAPIVEMMEYSKLYIFKPVPCSDIEL